MRMKYQALLLTLSMLIGGLSFAGEFKYGTVTQINHEKRTIEIDGKEYRATRDVMRSVRTGEQAGFAVQYLREEDDEQLVIELRRR